MNNRTGDAARRGEPSLEHGRGMSTRDYGSGYDAQREADDRDGWQRDRSDWEHYAHGRVLGEQRYGAQYSGHDGYGPPPVRKPLGKGPKGYVRTDERMKEEICERLASQDCDWSDVEVHVSDGEATLTGTVAHRELKYEADRVADSVRGIREVLNQIRVKSESTRALSSMGSVADGSTARRVAR